jgi:hypothetical protein
VPGSGLRYETPDSGAVRERTGLLAAHVAVALELGDRLDEGRFDEQQVGPPRVRLQLARDRGSAAIAERSYALMLRP